MALNDKNIFDITYNEPEIRKLQKELKEAQTNILGMLSQIEKTYEILEKALQYVKTREYTHGKL